ncbi:hypothetical protein ABIE09_000736 [Lysobacter enzymogenes]|uniref:hypothetical protein n=1 Tax=Lysobacter enzymogenes TaxID=69 RepID=UPI00339128CB
MSGAAWAPTVLCAALGLLLGFVPARVGWYAAMAFAAAWALVAGFSAATVALASLRYSPLACWIVVAAVAGALYAPLAVRERATWMLACAAGVCVAWASLAPAASAPSPWSPVCLALALPAHWLAARGGGIAVRIGGAWLLAVALLMLVSTGSPALPGDLPDHLE